jgi:hypothetical protein
MEQRENRRKERARWEKKITQQIWFKNKYEQKKTILILTYTKWMKICSWWSWPQRCIRHACG